MLSFHRTDIFLGRRLFLLVSVFLLGLAFSEPIQGQGLILSETSKTISEGSFPGEVELFSLEVRLATRPTAEVKVTFGSSNADVTVDTDPSAVGIQRSPLTFTPSNWQTDQSVHVIAANDIDYAHDIAVILLKATGGNYSSVTENMTVTVLDSSVLVVDTGNANGVLKITEVESAHFTVRLARKPSEAITVILEEGWIGYDTWFVNVELDTNARIPGNQSTLTFTPENWNRAQTVTVRSSVDNDDEDFIGSLDFILPGGASRSILLHVEDIYEETKISLAHVQYKPLRHLDIVEGGSKNFRIQPIRLPPEDFFYHLTSDNPDVTLSHTIWANSPRVKVSVAQDDDALDEQAVIHITSGTGIPIGSLTVSIIDDDASSVGLTLSKTNLYLLDLGRDSYSGQRNPQSSKRFTVKLDTQPSDDVRIEVVASDTALTVQPTSLIFTAENWNKEQKVRVDVKPDEDRRSEQSTVSLTASGGGYTGQAAIVSVDIHDLESIALSTHPGSLAVREGESGKFSIGLSASYLSHIPVKTTITLAQPGNTDVTIHPTSVTYEPGKISGLQTITVTAAEDQDKLDERATIFYWISSGINPHAKRGSLSIPIIDNDKERLSITPKSLIQSEGGSETFAVALTTQPTSDVTVTLTQPSNTDVTVDKTSLIFTASDWNRPQTVTASAAEDVDGAGESAHIELSASGAGYEAVSDSVTVYVPDNDKADGTPGLIVVPAILNVNEGGSDAFRVGLLSQPSDEVTVVIAQSNQVGVTADTTSLTFTSSNWDAPQSVRVSAAEDDDVDDETANITLTASGGGYAGINRDVTIKVRDDDTLGLTLSSGNVIVTEGGGDTFTVKLGTKPSGDVTVALTQPDNIDVTVSKTSLNFTVQNWDEVQTVAVSAAEDADSTNDRAVIGLTASGADYRDVQSSVSVVVKDNDIPALELSSYRLAVNEGRSGTFTVRLKIQPSSDVTVSLIQPHNTDVTADTDAGVNGNQNALIFTASNWNSPQTVTVNAAQDSDTANDNATIILTASGANYSNVLDSMSVEVTDNDIPALQLSANSMAMAEDSIARFTVQLATQPDEGVTVSLTQPDNTDVTVDTDTGMDGDQNTLTFTRANWNEAQTVTVSATRDSDTTDDSATIALTVSGGDYENVTGRIDVLVMDRDAAALIIKATDPLTVEEGSSARFTVRLAAPPSDTVTVTLTQPTNTDVTVDTDAGVDGHQNTLNFTVLNWSSPQTVTVSAVEDVDAISERVIIALTASGRGYENVTDSVDVSVTDKDMPRLAVTPTTLEVDEGDTAIFTVRLTAKPENDRTVTLTSDSTDVTLDELSLTFTTDNWDTVQTVRVSAAEDADSLAGSASVTLTASGGDYVDETKTVTVNVTDDDTAGLIISPAGVSVSEDSNSAFTVRLTTQPSANVILTLTQPTNTDVTVDTDAGTDGNQTALTFTASNWNTEQAVTVRAASDDDTDKDRAAITLTAAGNGYENVTGSVSVTVNDDSKPALTLSTDTLSITEEDGNTFTVRLATQPSEDVMVSLEQGDDASNPDVTLDKTTLTFTALNWNGMQTVEVSAATDDDTDNDSATIILMASGADYGDATGSVTVAVTDNDTPGLSPSQTSLTVAEGESSSFAVQLTTQPSADVTVTLTQSGTANPDLTVDTNTGTVGNQTTLTFTASNWSAAQTVTVSAAEDNDAVSDTATFRLNAAGGGYDDIAEVSVTVTVTEGDEAALLINAAAPFKITEDGVATFTVKLASEPNDDVTVTLIQPANIDVTVDTDTGTAGNQTSLTFTPGNWDEEQIVTVSAAEDDDAADDTAMLSLSASGSDYENVTGSIAATVEDNDEAGLIIAATAPYEVVEGGSATFMVQLATRPPAAVTVKLTQPSNTEVTADTDLGTTGSQTSLIFMALNWDTPQTVKVSADKDADTLNDSATISLTASGGNYGDATGEVLVTVKDSDEAGLIIRADADPLAVDEGESGTFMVNLATQPSSDVTVTLAQSSTANPDVTVDTDVGTSGNQTTLTFTTDNWDEEQTVMLGAAEDSDNLNDTATISLTASGADYGDVVGKVSVTVKDDDEAALKLSAKSLTVRESKNATFTVQLGIPPASNITVTLTQPANTDVTVDETSLIFTADDWNIARIVTVNTIEDDDTLDERATISLTTSGGGYDDVTASVAVTVDDNDVSGLTLSAAVLDITEGESATFMVKLLTQPTSNVTVTLAQPDNPNVTADVDPDTTGLQTVLIFTPKSWDTPQAVKVTAVQDDDTAPDRTAILMRASGADYGGRTAYASVVVTDDDASLTLSAADITVNEGESKTFAVQMSARPLGERTVALTSDNLDVTLSPASLTFTTADWDSLQTVTISTGQDEDKSNDHATVSLSGTGVISASMAVTVIDDDDHAVGLKLSANSLRVYEGDTASITVELAEQPGNPRNITLVSSSHEITFSPESLEFSGSGWDIPQSVTIFVAHDDDKINDSADVGLSGPGITAASLEIIIIDDEAGAPIEMERKAVKILLAEVASGLLSSTRDVVGQRFSMHRGTREATVAGIRIGLDRSITSDLAAGFAQRAGMRDASQGRFDPDRFGIDRRDADWLGGIRLERGRPVQSVPVPSGGALGAASLLSGFSYSAEPNDTGWSIWGRTGGGFTGADQGNADFDGARRHTWLGVDYSISSDWLIGMALGSSTSDFDYTLGRFSGSLETDMTMMLPYLEVTGDNGATGRVMFGIGSGEMSLLQTTESEGTADFSMQMISVSGTWPAAQLGNSRLSWSGDMGLATIDPYGTQNPALKGLSVDSMRVRGGVELIHDGFGEFWITEPQVGVLLRHDAGDGMVGTGIEVTAGLQVRSADDRFSLGVSLRRLGLHSAGEVSDWGAGVQFRMSSLGGGQGLTLSLGPSWGATEDDLLERDQAFRLEGAELQSRQSRQGQRGVEANLSYGLSVLGGLFTPYTEYRLTNSSYGSTRHLGNGIKFSDADRLELRLFSERQTSGQGLTRSRVRVELKRDF